MKAENKFPQSERLKSKKEIERLFNVGKSIKANPIRAIYVKNKTDNETPPKLVISIPKKNIPLATDRNILKRRIKEAYRLTNLPFKKYVIENDLDFKVMLIYNSKQIASFKEIEDKIKVILNRLMKFSEVAV